MHHSKWNYWIQISSFSSLEFRHLCGCEFAHCAFAVIEKVLLITLSRSVNDVASWLLLGGRCIPAHARSRIPGLRLDSLLHDPCSFPTINNGFLVEVCAQCRGIAAWRSEYHIVACLEGSCAVDTTTSRSTQSSL